MIPIHICDDNQLILTFLQKKIADICMFETYDFEIKVATTSPHHLLNEVKLHPRQGIYFLDVDLNEESMNGFELGKQLRAIDPRGFIVYITTYTELLGETFKYRVEALDYIPKDDDEVLIRRMAACLLEIDQRCKNDRRDTKEFFPVHKISGTTYVAVDDIIYFETSDKKHVVNLITKDGRIEFYGNLSEVQEILHNNFMRTHRSYLVNCNAVSGVDSKNKLVRLVNGEEVLLSRNRKKELLNKLSEY